MKTSINNSLLAKLTPKDKPYDVRDNRVTGFLVRVNVSGKLVYMCEFARGKRVTIGKADVLTPTQARDIAKEILADVIKGIDPRVVKSKTKNPTLKSFLDIDYGPWVLAHSKDGKRTLARIKRCFLSTLGDTPLEEITPIFIDQWRTQRLQKGRTKVTVNRDIATFKAALSKAVLWGLIDKNPLTHLKLLKIDTSPKVRYLAKHEESHLRSAINNREENLRKARDNANEWREERGYSLLPDLRMNYFADHLKPMILISMNTGMRQGELFNLTWHSIDFSKKIISISAEFAKSGKTRYIPMNNEAFEVLSNWRRQTNSATFVFESKDGNQFNNVRKAWLRLLKAAQIENFRWHDMRHHFASRLVMSEVDLNTVRELLGHSDIKMTLRYAHLAPEHKAMAVARLCD